MLRAIAIVCALVPLIRVECQVTWTTPNATGYCGTASENDTNVAPVLAVTLAATGFVAPVTYSIKQQPKDLVLSIATATSGAVTYKSGTVDFEKSRNFTFVVQATGNVSYSNGTKAVANSTNTCIVYVTDVNDHAPVFDPASRTVNAQDNLAEGSTVTKEFTATDGDGTAVNQVNRYELAAGNTGNDLVIVPTTGEIKVAAGKTLSAKTTSKYSLTIHAIDGGTSPKTGTGTLTVCVGCTDPKNGAETPWTSFATLLVACLAALKN